MRRCIAGEGHRLSREEFEQILKGHSTTCFIRKVGDDRCNNLTVCNLMLNFSLDKMVFMASFISRLSFILPTALC